MMDRRRWLLVILALVAVVMVVDVSRNGAGFLNALVKGVTLDIQRQLPTAHADLQYEFDTDEVEQLYLHVRGGRGTVIGADTDVVTARARVAIFASSTEAATAFTETLRLEGMINDGVLQPIVRDRKTEGVSRSTVYWTIQVPHELAVHVDGSLAAIDVADVDNVVTVGGSGSVSVARVGGIQGALRGGRLEVTDVSGDVAAKVSMSAAKIKRVGGNVRLSGDNAAMQITGVDGDVTIEETGAGVVWVGDVRGALDVEQSVGSLLAMDIDGPVTATIGSGEIEITPRNAAPIRVRAEHGSVDLRIPEDLWPQYTVLTNGSLRLGNGYRQFISLHGEPSGPQTIDVQGDEVVLNTASVRMQNTSDGTEGYAWPEELGTFGWEYEMNIGP